MAQEQGDDQILHRITKLCIKWTFFACFDTFKITFFKFFVSNSYHGNKKRPPPVHGEGLNHNGAKEILSFYLFLLVFFIDEIGFSEANAVGSRALAPYI